MGNYISMFEKTEEEAKIILHSNKGDFITGHADLTGLAVVEVQRLWTRFKQLGSDKKGYLPKKIIESDDLSQDVFIRNIIANLPKEKDGSLSFLVFLKFVHWMDTADVENKLKILFHFLNNGKDLDPYILEKFFIKLYPNSPVEEIKNSIDLFMKQLDTKRTGHINETQFVTNILRQYPDDQIKNLLDIDIIPPEVLNETNMQASVAGSKLNMRNEANNNSNLSVELDNRTLEMIADKAIKKDWEKLSIKLGFLEYDIQNLKNKHNGNTYETMLDILTQWRDQDPYLATKNRLRRYLDDSNMKDAASIL